jgi:hypothetical protein
VRSGHGAPAYPGVGCFFCLLCSGPWERWRATGQVVPVTTPRRDGLLDIPEPGDRVLTDCVTTSLLFFLRSIAFCHVVQSYTDSQRPASYIYHREAIRPREDAFCQGITELPRAFVPIRRELGAGWGMEKRKLQIAREHPLLVVCEYCNMQFSSGDSPLAKSDIQAQFNAHKCERKAQRSSKA